MSRKLNQYSSEFKESAIKLALEGDKSLTLRIELQRIIKFCRNYFVQINSTVGI